MYTKFAVWAGILAGALVGSFIGYLFGRVRGLSAYDRGFSDGERAAAQKMFELEADNQSLKRQLAIVVSVSESLDGQLTDTVRRQAIGSYDVGQYTKRDGNRVELIQTHIHNEGFWRDYRRQHGIGQSQLSQAQTQQQQGGDDDNNGGD